MAYKINPEICVNCGACEASCPMSAIAEKDGKRVIDAAKCDGQVDPAELSRIMDTMKSSGIGQEGVNYVIQKLQGPMETAKILSAVNGRPELAAQVYSASLIAIDVDTDAERQYLAKLANAMGLSPAVVRNIEQLTNNTGSQC